MRWLPVLPVSETPVGSGALTLGDPADRGAPAAAALPLEVAREKRVYLEVFGCQMNKLDAELMLGVLDDEGYRVTDRLEDAGVILYNTCAIREQAENRVFSKLGELRPLKRRSPDTVIGVLGCSAQNHQHELLRRFPWVGIVCGPGSFLRLPELIEESRARGQVAALDLDEPVRFVRRRNRGPNPFQAYVSVMRGCDMACTYCVVPRRAGPRTAGPCARSSTNAARSSRTA